MQVTKQVCDRIKFAFPERKFEKAKQQKKQRTLLKSYSRKSPYSKGFLGASSKPFVVVQSLSRAQLFATPWAAACQASLSFTTSWSLPKLMSIESVMPSNHLILCHPLLPPSIFPGIRVFSNESVLHIRWPKY